MKTKNNTKLAAMLALLATLVCALVACAVIFASPKTEASAAETESDDYGISAQASFQEFQEALATGWWDLSSDYEGPTLDIPYGRSLYIDLNGHTLRNIEGGSVIRVGGELTILSYGTITGGRADRGGGLYVRNTGKLTISSYVSIQDNQANQGGGVYVEDGGSFFVNNGCGIYNNRAGDGAGIYIENASAEKIGLRQVGLNENIAYNGGGIYIGGGDLTLYECTIQSNRATNGGGIYCQGDMTVENEVGISYNTATDGGGVFVTEFGTFTMNGGRISGNTANNKGGGVNIIVGPTSAGNAVATVTGGEISGNSGSGLNIQVYYITASINISGSPKIKDNAGGNICKDSDSVEVKLNITDALGSEADIGVNFAGVVTSGYKTYMTDPTDSTKLLDPSSYFTADDGGKVVLTDDGEVELLGVYKLALNANGGSGTMAESSMPRDEEKELPANGFTRTGYTFTGWNTGADGTGTAYADNATVKDLAARGETVTLYAQWTLNKPTVTMTSATINAEYCSDNTYSLLKSVSHEAGTGITYSYKWYKGTEEVGTDENLTVQKVADSGTYKVVVTASDGTLTAESVEAKTTVSITKANINPSVTLEDWTYGANAKTPNVTGNPENGTVTYNYVGTDNTNYGPSATQPTNAGTYTVTATIAATNNYNGNTATKSFNIEQKNLTVTVNNATVTYGDAKPDFTVSYNGFVDGEDEKNLTLTGLKYECSYTETSAVKDYTVTASGITAGNYAITYSPGTLKVTQREITVTVDSGLTSRYGDELVQLTATVTGSGIVNNDTNVYTLSTEASKTADVGPYDVTVTTNNSNYKITPANVTDSYTITQREITVTVDSGLTSRYGDELVQLTATVTGSGIVNNDTNVYTLSTEASKTADVGPYDVTVTTNNSNYKITPANVTDSYTITQREITVRVDDGLTSRYGDELVQLTATVTGSGIVNNDTNVYTLSTGASKTADVGPYDVTVTTNNSNYKITPANVTDSYTITQREITVRVDDGLTSVCGEAINPITYTITSGELVNGDSAEQVFELSTTATSASEAGNYDVTLTAKNTNYDITLENGQGAYEITKNDVSGDNTGGLSGGKWENSPVPWIVSVLIILVIASAITLTCVMIDRKKRQKRKMRKNNQK